MKIQINATNIDWSHSLEAETYPTNVSFIVNIDMDAQQFLRLDKDTLQDYIRTWIKFYYGEYPSWCNFTAENISLKTKQ